MTKNSLIQLNDFKRQWSDIGQDVLLAVEKVGKSGWLILGAEVETFEKHLSTEWGLPYAIGCGNGLDAIEIGLRCLKLKPGEQVLTTPLSAFATSLAIIRAGGVPVFVDVDAAGLIDLNLCEEVFKKNNHIRYFVPVHLFGHAINLKNLQKLKNTFHLKIVEDCAQAAGAKSFNLPVGSVGDFAATSFYPTKNLGAFGDAGAMLTRNANLAMLAKKLRDYGQSKKYIHDQLGMNSRLDEVHAAILSKILASKFHDYTERRCQIALRYCTEISNPRLSILPLPEDSKSVWHLFPILVDQSTKRSAFMAHMQHAGIQTGMHYPQLITQQAALKKLGKMQIIGHLTMANRIARREVSLPIHPYMLDSEITRVITACNSWSQ